MKKVTLLAVYLVCVKQILFAASGYFGDCAAFVDLQTTSNTRYEVETCSFTGHPAFHGTNLGTVSTLNLTYAEIQTWENSGDDVNSGTLRYRIWTGVPSGSFTGASLDGSLTLLGGGNERRSVSTSINLLSGLMGLTTYTLEIYFEAPFTYTGGGGGSGIHYLSNSNANYSLTFTTSATLPVSWQSFTATPRPTANLLAWATATERNNSHFEVERSADSRSWAAIGRVVGAGDSQQEQRYTFADAEPLPGRNYYRLRQVDFDGQFDYSGIVLAERPDKGGLRVFPNPAASAELRLSWPADWFAEELQLYAPDGRLTRRWTLAADQTEQPLAEALLPAGIYLARLVGGQGQELAVTKVWVQ